MQCACAVLYFYLWLYHIFPTLPYKRHDFRGKKITEQKMCDLISSTNSACNIFRSRGIGGVIINVDRSLHVKYPLFLPDFNQS